MPMDSHDRMTVGDDSEERGRKTLHEGHDHRAIKSILYGLDITTDT
jgi:hypothetical protein